MLFNSIAFLVFLPIVFVGYWFVFKKLNAQNFFVLIASYVFYGWWDCRFLGLILLTTILSYLSGLLIEKYEGKRNKQKLVSAANIIINLGILGFFKYFNFFAESMAQLLGLFGVTVDSITVRVILPVGVSFYTFQALSYSIDVYKGKLAASKSFVNFAAYLSFFPQLVAGPIERATNLLPQFQKERHFDYKDAVDGCRHMLWGFFKKIVIADNCAVTVNQIFANWQNCDGTTLIIGAFLFSFQIYGDFSGYSDIAIGTAKLFGIQLMTNFNLPYFSRNPREFWSKWHISLTSWFTDYIYIPLGGNRKGTGRTILNSAIVFALCGLWHGANWTFVLWGLYHSFLFLVFILLGVNIKYKTVVAPGKILPSIKEFLQMLMTFCLALIGWIIFRATTVSQAFGYIGGMFTAKHVVGLPVGKKSIILVLVMVIIEWLQRDKRNPLQFDAYIKNRTLRWALYYIMLIVIVFLGGRSASFIYFQF